MGRGLLVGAALVALLAAPGGAGARTGAEAASPGRIVFSDEREDRDLFLVRAGERPVRIPSSSRYESQPALSPDGRTIAFVSDRFGNAELELIAVDGSGRRRLTSDPAYDGAPAWSPDGSRLAFVRERAGSADLYVMSVDGAAAARVTTAAGYESDPAWSPDGRRLAFSRAGSIYVVPVEGGPEVRVSPPAVALLRPAWSPDGRRLAVQVASSSIKDAHALAVVAADGGGLRELNVLPDVHKFSPAWSRDGRILFSARGVLYAVAPDGGTAERLVPEVAVPSDDWSGDERLAVFSRDVAPGRRLYGVRSTGEDLGRVVDAVVKDPAFSRDGRRIAFFGGRGALYVMPAAGGPRRRVTPPLPHAGAPSWAPDGRRLVIAATRGLLVVDVARGTVRRLRDTGRNDSAPDWSPDGREIAFARHWRGRTSIYLVAAAGGRPRLLRHGADGPIWSPRGDRIAFANDWFPPYDTDVWTMRADGTAARRFVRRFTGEAPAAWSPDGRSIAYFGERGRLDSEYGLYVMPAAGGRSRLLLSWRDDGIGDVAWLPR
jgi:Tol biopolymer transport system component